MNHPEQMILETTQRIFSDGCDKRVVDEAETGHFPANLWQTLEANGLTQAAVSEALGGSGSSPAASMLILRAAGFAAAPLPLADTFVAGQLLANAGLAVPKGRIGIALAREQAGDQPVNFAPWLDYLLFVREAEVALLHGKDINWQSAGTTLAGEPTARINTAPLKMDFSEVPKAAHLARAWGAAARVSLMAGAMEAILDMSVTYAMDRQQFGRPLAKFQAIQHQLAVLAGEVAACQRAADTLLTGLDITDIAIAKARVGEAVQPVAEIAHQVHGAIGYSLEHALNLRTRRLWAWREECGAESFWQLELGKQLCNRGADNLWDSVTNAGQDGW